MNVELDIDTITLLVAHLGVKVDKGVRDADDRERYYKYWREEMDKVQEMRVKMQEMQQRIDALQADIEGMEMNAEIDRKALNDLRELNKNQASVILGYQRGHI